MLSLYPPPLVQIVAIGLRSEWLYQPYELEVTQDLCLGEVREMNMGGDDPLPCPLVGVA